MVVPLRVNELLFHCGANGSLAKLKLTRLMSLNPDSILI